MDYDVLIDLWRKQVPEKYAISARRLESHSVGSSTFDLDLSHWVTFDRALKGFIGVKASPAKLYDGPDVQTAHLSFLVFEDYEWAKQMLDEVVPALRGKGFTKLVFGQDNRHFFPGAPIDWPILEEFLKQYGFEAGGEQVDVERDLADYVSPCPPLAEGFVCRVCESGDLPALRAFFETTFSGRWRHDVLEKWNLEGPETVMGLFEGEVCHGFALIQQDGCNLPIGGAVWGMDLGANWGSLGPIGISEAVRGKGLGDGLLAAGLLELQKRGARRTIIDWTTLIEFYGKHGFQVNRTYRTYSLPL